MANNGQHYLIIVFFLDLAAILPQYWTRPEINIAPMLLQYWRNIHFQWWAILANTRAMLYIFSNIVAILPQYWCSIATISAQYCGNAGIQCLKPILRQLFQKTLLPQHWKKKKHCGNNEEVCWRDIAPRSDCYLVHPYHNLYYISGGPPFFLNYI